MRPLALAMLLLGGGPPHWFRPTFAPPASLDEPCAIQARTAEGEHHPDDRSTVVVFPWDLDGDQRPDVFAVHGCGATGNCTGLVYLSSQGCRRSAGLLHGVRFERLARRSGGVAGLSSFFGAGCAGNAGVITDWAWDGNAYRRVNTIACHCGDEPDAKPNSARCSPLP